MKILLSIHPEHADNIFSGEKRFEYRRRIPKDKSVDTVVLYATSPVCAVVGEFTISGIVSGMPEIVWNETMKFAGISYWEFATYFEGCIRAYAIGVKNATEYWAPMGLVEVIGRDRPPQSFQYIR